MWTDSNINREKIRSGIIEFWMLDKWNACNEQKVEVFVQIVQIGHLHNYVAAVDRTLARKREITYDSLPVVTITPKFVKKKKESPGKLRARLTKLSHLTIKIPRSQPKKHCLNETVPYHVKYLSLVIVVFSLNK